MINLICKLTSESNSRISPLLSFDDKHVAFVVDMSTIQVIEYNKKDKKIVKLEAHKEPIRCLRLSHNLLFSCSADSVFVWNLLSTSLVTKPKTITNRLKYEPTFCSFNRKNDLLAVCNGDHLSLFQIESSNLLEEIKLNEYVHQCEFISSSHLMALTNQSLLVYDLKQHRLVETIKNTTISSSFSNVSCLTEESLVLISTSDGCLNIYTWTPNDPANFLKSFNLEKLYKNQKKTSQKVEDGIEMSFLVIGMYAFSLSSESNSNESSECMVVCATSSCLFLIDINSDKLLNLIEFNDLPFNTKHLNMNCLIPQVAEFALFENKQINAALLYLFNNEINVIKCADISRTKSNPSQELSSASTANETHYLSVIPKSQLAKDSPLNEEIKSKEISQTKAPTLKEFMNKPLTVKKNSLDKPLTFNSRIRSSGYSSEVKREKFTPLVNKNRIGSSLQNLQRLQVDSNKVSQKETIKKREFNFELPLVLNKKFDATDRSTPITQLKFTDDGQHMALASSDNLIQVLASNHLDKPGVVFNGHTETIRSIDLSHNCKYLISASNDKTCKIWSLNKPNELLLDIKSIKSNDSVNIPLKKDITTANFFYLDKFVIIGTENSFYLCKYFIDQNKDDVQRYLNGSICKLIKKMDLTFAQSITTLSAINSFFSYLVICAGTNKTIEIFDMNVAKSSMAIHEAHSRVFHQIVQNGSEFNQYSYDLFATTAPGDGVKLWDLRTGGCVNTFDSHINRCLPLRCSFSTDSKYISIGSEDRSTFVYDLRKTSVVQKYGVFSDTVTCAEFNPHKSQLVCSTLDGKLYSYRTK